MKDGISWNSYAEKNIILGGGGGGGGILWMVQVWKYASSLHLYPEIEAAAAASVWKDDSSPDIRSRAKQGKTIQNIPAFVIIAVSPKWQQLFHWAKRIFLCLTKLIKRDCFLKGGKADRTFLIAFLSFYLSMTPKKSQSSHSLISMGNCRMNGLENSFERQ